MGGRTERLLEIAGWRPECLPLAYTGIDLFESRDDSQPRLTIKWAHRELRRIGTRTRLIPGDPLRALSRAANVLVGTDLLLIAAGQEPESLAQAWRYVPRMLHAGSLVFQQLAGTSPGQDAWRQLGPLDVQKLAAQAGRALLMAA